MSALSQERNVSVSKVWVCSEPNPNCKDSGKKGAGASVSGIMEDLNDDGSLRSEAIRSVSPANEARAALPR